MSNWPEWFAQGEVRKPQQVTPQQWQQVGDRVIEAVSRARNEAPECIGEPYVFTSAVTKVLLAADSQDPINEIFVEPRLAELVVIADLRYTERPCAYAVAKVIAPYAQQVAPSFKRSVPDKPYTEHDIVEIRDWANFKQRGFVTRNKRLVLALGLGAGLTGKEMDELRWNQIAFDSKGFVVHLPDRDIPVHHDFDRALRENRPVHEDGLSDYVLSPTRKRRLQSATTVIVNSADQGLTPTLSRMRITWINQCVTAGIPPRVVQKVAGITNDRYFDEIVGGFETDQDIWSVRGLFHENSSPSELSAVESLVLVAVDPTKLAVPTEPRPAVTTAHFTAGVEPDFTYEYPDEALSAADHEHIVRAYLETTWKHPRVRNTTTPDIFRTDTNYPMLCEDCSGWGRDGAVAAWNPDTGWVVDLHACPTCKGRGWVVEDSLDARERARAGDCVVEHWGGDPIEVERHT